MRAPAPRRVLCRNGSRWTAAVPCITVGKRTGACEEIGCDFRKLQGVKLQSQKERT